MNPGYFHILKETWEDLLVKGFKELTMLWAFKTKSKEKARLSGSYDDSANLHERKKRRERNELWKATKKIHWIVWEEAFDHQFTRNIIVFLLVWRIQINGQFSIDALTFVLETLNSLTQLIPFLQVIKVPFAIDEVHSVVLGKGFFWRIAI